jgi:hypothetical protein
MLVSLNRIQIDRVLYSKFNQTLSNILLKVYSYISANEHKDEMMKRLLEELYEMAHTCSTGFATRICNTISGFGDLSVRISFEDQVVSNYVARMNKRARDIILPNSIYYTTKHREIVEIYMINNNLIKKKKSAKELENKDTLGKLIDRYLSENKEEKIKLAVEEFADNVLCELIDSEASYDNRRNFVYFFKDNMLSIRDELYQEFKDYMTDGEFDLISRKCVASYEGLEFLI